MRTVTPAQAARLLPALLAAAGPGQVVAITVAGRPVAEVTAAGRGTGADLRAALAGTTPPEEDFAAVIAEALALVTPPPGDAGA